jgi:hypothetical protein
MLNGELAYIRPAGVQRLRTTTTATTSTPSAHAAALLIRMLQALLVWPVAMSCRANFSLTCELTPMLQHVCYCRALSLEMTPGDVAACLLLLLGALDGLCGAE